MSEQLAALIVEDSPSDAALMVRRLREALQRQSWDVIMADFSLPGFDAHARRRHRAAESALERSEQQKALMIRALDSASTPMAICDQRGRIEWINAAFTGASGFTAAASLGLALRRLAGAGTTAVRLRAIQASELAAGQSWSGEMTLKRKDGSLFPAQVTLTPVKDSAGAVAHLIAIMHDLTEQRRQEERLMESQRLEAIGQLAGLAGMIRTAAGRGAELTRALLAFARKQELAPQVIDVNRLILDMRPMLSRALGEQVELRLVPMPELASALIDSAQLESALLNLCINARDAMPAGGKLSVRTGAARLDDAGGDPEAGATPGDYLVVTVSDTGCGIAPEQLTKVFEPFFTTKERGKGTGLGLSQVYGFIKQSGGHISLDSEPGRGTTVKLYIPRAGGADS